MPNHREFAIIWYSPRVRNSTLTLARCRPIARRGAGAGPGGRARLSPLGGTLGRTASWPTADPRRRPARATRFPPGGQFSYRRARSSAPPGNGRVTDLQQKKRKRTPPQPQTTRQHQRQIAPHRIVITPSLLLFPATPLPPDYNAHCNTDQKKYATDGHVHSVCVLC